MDDVDLNIVLKLGKRLGRQEAELASLQGKGLLLGLGVAATVLAHELLRDRTPKPQRGSDSKKTVGKTPNGEKVEIESVTDDSGYRQFQVLVGGRVMASGFDNYRMAEQSAQGNIEGRW